MGEAPAAEVRVPDGNRSRGPSVCRPELYPLSHSPQGVTGFLPLSVCAARLPAGPGRASVVRPLGFCWGVGTPRKIQAVEPGRPLQWGAPSARPRLLGPLPCCPGAPGSLAHPPLEAREPAGRHGLGGKPREESRGCSPGDGGSLSPRHPAFGGTSGHLTQGARRQPRLVVGFRGKGVRPAFGGHLSPPLGSREAGASRLSDATGTQTADTPATAPRRAERPRRPAPEQPEVPALLPSP